MKYWGLLGHDAEEGNLTEHPWNCFSSPVCWTHLRLSALRHLPTFLPVFLLLTMHLGSLYLFSSKVGSPLHLLNTKNQNMSLQKWCSYAFSFFLHNSRFPEAWMRIICRGMAFRIRPFGHFGGIMGGKTLSQNQTILLHSRIMRKTLIPSVSSIPPKYGAASSSPAWAVQQRSLSFPWQVFLQNTRHQ